jgi:hypothetical protein
MKQKKVLFTLAASAMIAAGFTSCSVDDNPIYEGAVPFPVVDNFDEGSEIKNGTCEGSLVANFWCHEWRTSAAQFDGAANIVRDPADPNNHCCAVVIRSEEEAKAAGNMIEANGKIAGWDSQFFITLGEDLALKEKDQIRLKMKIKADAPQEADTQTHKAPGAYMHWACVGNPKFTTEWTDFDSGWQTLASNQTGMYTIAFNLSRGIHNTVYFDDMYVEVKRYDPLDEGNAVSGGSFEYITGSDAYWCHEWRTSDAQFDGRANVVVDPANEKNHCAAVVIRSNAEAFADGTAVTTDGQPLKEDFSNFAEWDSQFFISVGKDLALKEGDKLQLKMKVKADSEMKGVGTQTHGAPGAYMHWACAGNVDFTTEWKEFDSGVQTMASNQAGMYTIAFNLSKGIHNTVYFDDIQVIVTRAE